MCRDMLRLGVYGSDGSILKSVREVLLSYPGAESVTLFNEREELFRHILHADDGPHVVLLDLRYGDSDQGQTLRYAEELYDLAPDVEVLLLLPKLGADAFQRILLRPIRLLGIITGTEDRELLFDYLDKAMQKQAEEGTLSYSSHGKQYALELRVVLYLESRNHVIIAHTAQKTFSFYGKLSELRLPDYFVQCHKSYLVNTRQVLIQENKCLVMSNGDIIPVSRAYRENVHDKLRSRGEG